MKRNTCLLLLVMCLLSPCLAQAKRPAPKPVAPVEYNGVKYFVAEDASGITGLPEIGVVTAADIQSGQILWKKKVYDVKIKPGLEEDVQQVFISNLQIKDGQLLVTDETGRKFGVDLTGGRDVESRKRTLGTKTTFELVGVIEDIYALDEYMPGEPLKGYAVTLRLLTEDKKGRKHFFCVHSPARDLGVEWKNKASYSGKVMSFVFNDEQHQDLLGAAFAGDECVDTRCKECGSALQCFTRQFGNVERAVTCFCPQHGMQSSERQHLAPR